MSEISIKGKVLFVATVSSHIYYFHMPFMKIVRDMGYVVEVAAKDKGFAENIEKEGFKFYNIPFSRNPLSFFNVKGFFLLIKLLKDNKYTMIHIHTPVASFVGRFAGRIAKVPHLVYTAHGFHFHEYGNKFKNFAYFKLEKLAGMFSDVLITINKDDYEIAKKKNLTPNGKVVYIKGVGVDTSYFNPARFTLEEAEKYRKVFELITENFVMISVAELIKRKNIEDIITSVGMLVKTKAKLLVVGDGILRKELTNFAKEKGLNESILFLGRRNDVPNLLQISDVLVFTSHHEGLPKAVMEAMAMEKPVVAYNIRGVRDLVVDGETGFLVPYRNVQQLAEKVLYLMNNPEIARKMGRKGRERIEKEFSIEKIKAEMSNLYREILGG